MDDQAQKHLRKAGEYLAKGDEFYRHAAVEMDLARQAGKTWNEIGDHLGRSSSWCKRIVEWSKTPANDGSAAAPFGDEADKTQAERRERNYVKKALAENPASVAKEIAEAVKNPEVARAVAREAKAIQAINDEITADEVAVKRETGEPLTAADALGDPKLRMKLAANKAKADRMRAVREAIVILTAADAQEVFDAEMQILETEASLSVLDSRMENIESLAADVRMLIAARRFASTS